VGRTVRTSRVDVSTPSGTARLHVRAVGRARALVVLGHGAGRGVDTPDLLSLADGLPEHGVSVVLVDQPWVVEGRRVAVAPAALDLAWAPAVAAARAAAGASRRTPLVTGGRSAGARVACRTATATATRPDALLLLAFPLVPPAARASTDRVAAALARRREELYLPLAAGIAVVVAQGERDAFGPAAELGAALETPGPGALEVWPVTGADHSLRVRRGAPDPAPALLDAALRAVDLARGE
jgi:predicted alpha/beta-hydrolase family hydrolase